MQKKILSIERYSHLAKLLWRTEYPADRVTYVVGDIDGSFCRLFLSAHIAGFIDIKDDAFGILATLLYKESIALKCGDLYGEEGNAQFQEFQSDTTVHSDIESLLTASSHKKPNNRLVFLGDLLFDRLSNNLPATIKFIKNLHNTGAVFIKGNHDYFSTFDHDISAYGANRCKIGEDSQEIEKEIDNCFKLAHYDPDFKILYTHAALGIIDDRSIIYVNSKLKETDGLYIADHINAASTNIDHVSLQDFRPGSKDYDSIQYPKYIPENFLHIHGHQESMDPLVWNINGGFLPRERLSGVLRMNSRLDRKFFPAMTCIIKSQSE